jgi:hypothetical protein
MFYFICGLFNNAVSSSDYTSSGDKMINNELERTWKEMVVAKFKVLPLSGGNEETIKNLS